MERVFTLSNVTVRNDRLTSKQTRHQYGHLRKGST